jgi:hypothetical protein
MSKTPFEIRQELLSLAKDRLSTEYFSKLEETRAFDDPAVQKEFLKNHQFPTAAKIIEEAQLLNEFVSGTSDKK